MTGIPKVIKVTYTEIAIAIDKSVSKIEEAVLKALEISPPELSADIYVNGIHLTGGGALLRGLDKRLAAKTKLPIHIAEDPLRAVVSGTGAAIKNIEGFQECTADLKAFDAQFISFIYRFRGFLVFLCWKFYGLSDCAKQYVPGTRLFIIRLMLMWAKCWNFSSNVTDYFRLVEVNQVLVAGKRSA